MTEKDYFDEICSDFFPVFRKFSATDQYSITLHGSRSKGTSDHNSDFDFGFFYEEPADLETRRLVFQEVNVLCEKWKKKGIVVDGFFPRTYEEVDKLLDSWLSGKEDTIPYVWTIWGYHLLPELYNLKILVDPYGQVARWKEKLAVFPPALKKSIIDKHSFSLKYWRDDYHYQNKVKRKDVVFLASLTARLVHDILQVLFALNECYYPGDGSNLKFTKAFSLKPQYLEERITQVFQLTDAENTFDVQYQNICSLIDDTLKLVELKA